MYNTQINDTMKDIKYYFCYFQSQLPVFWIYLSLNLCIKKGKKWLYSYLKCCLLNLLFSNVKKGQNEAQRKSKGLQERGMLLVFTSFALSVSQWMVICSLEVVFSQVSESMWLPLRLMMDTLESLVSIALLLRKSTPPSHTRKWYAF